MNLISVCVPTYNRPHLLEQLLKSILNQSYNNIEVIITDNSSNNETYLMIRSEFNDPRVKYYKNESNLGMGGNTRKAISLAKGDYFTFTADDDLWTNTDKLLNQHNFLNLNCNINIVYCNASSIDYSGKNLSDFTSIYNSDSDSIILNSIELLPGYNTKYFLNILTPLIRSKPLKNLFLESWSFDSEEYFCYYLGSIDNEIGFLFDKMVALRETDHHRTTIENGVVIDWKTRADIRIKQIFNIYNTLTFLYPETKLRLQSQMVQNFLLRHLLSKVKQSKKVSYFIYLSIYASLYFENSSFIKALKLNLPKKHSFG